MKNQSMHIAKFLIFLIIYACEPADPNPSLDELANVYGAEANPTGDEIGGGKCYSHAVNKGDYIVSDAEALIHTLARAKAGEVVFVNPNSNINLTGYKNIQIPEGVTLAGNRGVCDAEGPLIYSNDLYDGWLFDVMSNVRITGLRFKGPDANFPDINYDVVPESYARAIVLSGENIEIDNCEISNFHHGGVEAYEGTKNIHIHHNFLHDIHAYPVGSMNRSGLPILIEANIIHWVWHAMSGSGYPGTGYEARYNIIIRNPVPDAWQPYEGSHAIDMHDYTDVAQERQIYIAGEQMTIHHNTFINEAENDPSSKLHQDVYVRGTPRVLAKFYNNRFANANPAQAVRHENGNVWVYNNLYGSAEELILLPPECTPQIIFNQPPPPNVDIPTLTGNHYDVNIKVNVFDTLQLKRVSIELNNAIIYEGTKAPANGNVFINMCNLDQSLDYQKLSVTAIDSRGVVGRHITVFKAKCKD